MNTIKDNIRNEEAKKLLDKIQESGDLMLVKEMIKDNKIEFILKDKKYRIRMLNLREKEELDLLRRKKFGQMLQDKDILLEKDLIEIYKQRGIDIDLIDEDIKKINTLIKEKELLLGASLENNEGESVLKTYHEQIIDLNTEVQVLLIKKTNLLEYSLENQLLVYVSKMVTYLSTEIYFDGKWTKQWNSEEEFLNCNDEELINKAATISMALQYNS